MKTEDMDSNDDEENDMEFGSMPSFIPNDAPEVKPLEVKGEAELKSADKLEYPIREVKELTDGTRVETWCDAAGQAHREGAAAIVKTFPNGTREELWFQHGKLHREDGPAVMHADGSQEYWINGECKIEQKTVVSVNQVRQESPAASVRAPVAEVAVSSAVDRQEIKGDQQVPPDVRKALMAVVNENAKKQAEQEQSVAGGGAGAQAAQSGLRGLVDGSLGLVGGLAALAGAVGRGVGGVASTLASEVEAKRQAGDTAPVAPRFAPGISVLPRISEYRVEQAEKMANAYESAMEKFWASGKLPDVRRAIEEHARETGASVPDVMAKMVPGGEMEGLRTRFVEAVGESSDAQDSKKAMDRALDSWVRQYGRGSEELLNPETGQNPDYDSMRERFEGTREKMAGLVTQSPVFAGEEKLHAERFREAVERITQRIQEMLQRVAEFIRGRSAGADQREESSYEP